MTTHGTRSAYNHGCRCDACREASRLSRARQRAAAKHAATCEATTGMPGPWLFVIVFAAAGTGSLLARVETEAAQPRGSKCCPGSVRVWLC